MRPDKKAAKLHGIGKAHRQYANRYGAGVEQMVQDQKRLRGRRWAVGDRRAKKTEVI